ncbi:unnamed protein product, partial [Adineta steineri]
MYDSYPINITKLYDQQRAVIPIDNSTYEDLFSDISMPQNPEPPPQQILSPSLPILSPPQSTNITPITN